MAGDKPGPDKGEGGRPMLRALTSARDWAEFEKLCQFHCTMPEIASWYGISEDTLNRRCQDRYGKTFAVVLAENRLGGKVSLRRAQFQKAISNGGNVPLLIWLGKNMLEQSDSPLPSDGDGHIMFVSRIGPGGNVIQEVKKMAEATDLKTFEVTDMLKEHLEGKIEEKKVKRAVKKKAKK